MTVEYPWSFFIGVIAPDIVDCNSFDFHHVALHRVGMQRRWVIHETAVLTVDISRFVEFKFFDYLLGCLVKISVYPEEISGIIDDIV